MSPLRDRRILPEPPAPTRAAAQVANVTLTAHAGYNTPERMTMYRGIDLAKVADQLAQLPG